MNGPLVKTTSETSDLLAGRAKTHATRANITPRSQIERGLLDGPAADSDPDRFVLRDARVGAWGLQPPNRKGDWARLREAANPGGRRSGSAWMGGCLPHERAAKGRSRRRSQITSAAATTRKGVTPTLIACQPNHAWKPPEPTAVNEITV